MRWTRSLSRWLAAAAAGLVSVSLVLALVGATPRADNPVLPQFASARSAEVVPLFGTTEPAANDPVLILQTDDRGVRGWVAGKESYQGAKVALQVRGKNHEATVGADNTFHWEHKPARRAAVTATVTLDGRKPLTARTLLVPPLAGADENYTAFFITDRSAYRPGHTLKFVAYLRKLLPNGEFEPVREGETTVDLTSETRQTRAVRMKLPIDANGRITGEYTFSDADALDHYTLTASGGDFAYAGGARVMLGEYRKSKVGLKLKGEVKDGKLVVAFDARDYLDRPVKGTAASYTATVIRNADLEKLTLNPDEFAKPEGGPPSPDDIGALPDDERLITLAHGVSAMTFAGFGSRFVAAREGTVPVATDGSAKLELDLNPDWLKGSHTVTVSGVFTDDTGRENRASGTFKIDPNPTRGVKVSAPKELFATNEKIAVTLAPFGFQESDKPATTLLVVRLDAQPSFPWIDPELDPEGEVLPDNTRLPALSIDKVKKPAEGWKSVPVFDPVKRRVVDVVPVAGDAADVAIKHPGAYKLLAITRLADGTSMQSETGVVVKSPAKLPGVMLQLDRREIDSASRLTGVVHTRFAGAKLLLTLRDSQGIKLTKTLTAGANGVAHINEALPANLRYGCAVSVFYPESAATIHADQRELFVIPTDRTIEVKVAAPAEVGPGADVNVGIQVNRQEETDLIVSAFDESLIGVSGDLSKNIRNFYLADASGQGKAARELAATRVGAVTVAELITKAEELRKDKDRFAREPGLERQLERLVERWKEGKLGPNEVVLLIRLAGFEVYSATPYYYGNGVTWRVSNFTRLADLFRRGSEDRDTHISATVINNTVLFALASPGDDPWAGYRGNPYGHGFGFGQFGQFGNLAGQFGLAGFGGRGFGAQFGFAGFGGRGFGGQFGLQGSFSHIFPGGNTMFTHVGGQFGMSFGYNRDFGPQAPGGATPLPALGVATELVRRDFADSAFWSAKVRTDATGKATATFKLPDSLTNWRVQVTAVSAKMHVGTGHAVIKSRRAISIWPMLPRTFTEGDTVRVFGTVHNLTDVEQTIRVHLKAENGQVMDEPERTVKVAPKGNVPVYWTFKAGTKGFTDLLMSATCAAGSDASLKKLPVTPAGVLERATASGLVGKGDLKVTLPADFDAGRATVTVTVAPTLAADLADTLPYLVEYPYGCVEQTMSRFLPAIRVAAILRQYGLSTIKELEAKLPKVVEAGQKRLIELQQPDGGWAWNGNGGTHEMMTPYALFGLIAAEEAGYPCPNPHTIANGLHMLQRYLSQMGEAWDTMKEPDKARPSIVNDALFCLWVYASKADPSELIPWWKRIENTVGLPVMSDYGHALALELAVKRDKRDLAKKLAAELRKRAKKSGDLVYWTTAGFSRWGDNTTEVTAMVMKALVAYNANDPLIPGVLAYFHTTKRGDRWDSTKDTACVLYALCDYLAAVRAGPAAAGVVKINVNGTDDGSVQLDSPLSKVVKLTGKTVKAGENVFKITGSDTSGNALARVVVTYTRGRDTDIPARDTGVKVERTVSVRGADGKWTELKSGATVPFGSYVKVRVTATPADDLDVRYTLLESPKPAGGETVPADDPRFRAGANTGYVLREDREAMTCFHYEHASGAFGAEYVVLTEFAGEFRVPPARVELMYKPTVGGHSDSFVLKVEEKK
jgi:hypothetical protein